MTNISHTPLHSQVVAALRAPPGKRKPRMLAETYRKPEKMALLQKTFASEHYVRLPLLFAPTVFISLTREITTLQILRKMRNFTMTDYETPRHMSVIGGRVIHDHSPFLTAVYHSDEMTSFISAVTGGPVYPCTHQSEWAVINFLEDAGETHGWHLDDPPFALVLIVEAPPVCAGGLVEYIPGWIEHCEVLKVSPKVDVSRSIDALRNVCRVHAVHHATSDAYLLRADRCLHRVSPLTGPGRRIVVNFAFEATLTAR